MKNKIMDSFYHLFQLPAIIKNQWRTSQEIEIMQLKKLKKIVEYSNKYVPYYTNCFKIIGFKPTDINSISDLNKIPILSKDTLRSNYPENILSKNQAREKYNITETSGSSGKKLTVAKNLDLIAKFRLMQFRQFYSLGYSIFDKMVYLRPGQPGRFAFQKIGIFRRFFISTFEEPMKQIDQILQIKPQVIFAYPSTLYLIAKTIQNNNIKVDILPLKFIITNSELLTDEIRQTIQKIFHCKVYDEYSCLEFLAIGFECEKQKMHIASDNVIVEVVDKDDKTLPLGEEGRLIITNLNNRITPYLRYEIGDIGSISTSQCSCGRGFSIFSKIIGRNDDFLITREGKELSPRSIRLIFSGIIEILEFQVIQNSVEQLEIFIVLAERPNLLAVKKNIQEGFETIFGYKLAIAINFVPKIERTGSGKHRFLKSKVSK